MAVRARRWCATRDILMLQKVTNVVEIVVKTTLTSILCDDLFEPVMYRDAYHVKVVQQRAWKRTDVLCMHRRIVSNRLNAMNAVAT